VASDHRAGAGLAMECGCVRDASVAPAGCGFVAGRSLRGIHGDSSPGPCAPGSAGDPAWLGREPRVALALTRGEPVTRRRFLPRSFVLQR